MLEVSLFCDCVYPFLVFISVPSGCPRPGWVEVLFCSFVVTANKQSVDVSATIVPLLTCCWAERSVLPLPPAVHTVYSWSLWWRGSVSPEWRYSEEFSDCHSTPGRMGSPGKSINITHIVFVKQKLFQAGTIPVKLINCIVNGNSSNWIIGKINPRWS